MSKEKEIVCITGGIGAGKSVVSRILRLSGFMVYDCDLEARLLMERNVLLRNSVCSIAGHDVYCDDGTLDRPLLAERLFGNSEVRMRINACVHEAVRNHILHIFSKFTSGIMFVESAIPVTAKITDICRKVWLVEADPQCRIERVVLRNNMTRDAIVKRMESQQGEVEMLFEMKQKGIVGLELLENNPGSDLLGQINRLLNYNHES